MSTVAIILNGRLNFDINYRLEIKFQFHESLETKFLGSN